MTFEWCLNDDETVFEHEEHVFAPYTGACGRAYAIRPYSGTRIMYPAFLAGVPDASGLSRGWEVWPGTSKARTKQTSPASVDARRLPQTPRGSVHQNFELAPPPPLRPPPQEPPLELLLLPLLHERLLRSSSRSRMVDELLSFSKVSSSFS